MRKLASIVKIDSIEPIEGADRIEVAHVKGWKVVVAKNEFKVGDLAAYFEIDSFLDANDERYAFLRERCLRKFVSKSGTVLREGIRIKTVKLRGVISQGLLIPLDKFIGKEIGIAKYDGEEELYANFKHEATEDCGAFYERVCLDVGSDLTEILKVEHYDEVKEQCSPQMGGNPIAADAYGKFPTDRIPKTDEERIQNCSEWIKNYSGRTWEVSAKDDGSSCTIFYSPTIDAENPFGVCSRNLRLKPVTESGIVPMMWLLAKKYLVEEKLKELYEKEGKEWALQGEAVAPGLQKNRDKYLEPEWHVFRIWDIKNQRFISPDERREFCKSANIPHVQIVATKMPVFKVYTTVDEILKFAEGKTARGNEREGLVFKTDDGLEPTLSFKAVSNRYLMKSED